MISGGKTPDINKLLQELGELLQKIATICKVIKNVLRLGAIEIGKLPWI